MTENAELNSEAIFWRFTSEISLLVNKAGCICAKKKSLEGKGGGNEKNRQQRKENKRVQTENSRSRATEK